MSGDKRSDRLVKELTALKTLAAQSDVFTFEARGNPPDEYEITLNGKGLSRGSVFDDTIECDDVHKLKIRLGYSYPTEPPEIRWSTPVFHPNLSAYGYLRLEKCGLEWNPDTTLDKVCTRLWDMVRGEYLDLDNASDYSARKWFEKHPDYPLPVDSRALRPVGSQGSSSNTEKQLSASNIELLKALIVLSAADGVIAGSERGLLERFARGVGMSGTSLNASIDHALKDGTCREKLFRRVIAEPDQALELLVTVARMDGEISEPEKDVLLEVGKKLKIKADDFARICKQGIQRAKALRKRAK